MVIVHAKYIIFREKEKIYPAHSELRHVNQIWIIKKKEKILNAASQDRTDN
jgi:hypothetical protein